ncbi:DoxX family protein [Cohnella lupini]|uniref:Putative membrane protein YphA (DoxX/SURF4 family) n=1 Tax=Cohnella lupini TaxID=1294267 RepID=A0A3D9I2F8_9BACL|nr:DoxX family protein [Cohnella lupini]RED55943.1 putative membrane protein YphA (DoxX/SURF4 family) [Cohnella lupini]
MSNYSIKISENYKLTGTEQTVKVETLPRGKGIAYWVATALLAFVVGSGGIGDITYQWGTLETEEILGYPSYFMTVIGIWKVLGAIAILVPGFPRIKEWAYAGIFFEMTGAAASHAFAEDYGAYAYHILTTIGFAALTIVSWASRPKNRKL